MEVLELTTLSSPYVIEKGKGKLDDSFVFAFIQSFECRWCWFPIKLIVAAIITQNYAPHQPLTHMQKDLRLGLSLSEQIEHAMPITAATNEVFKHAKRIGYSEHDVSAVYVKSRL